MSTFADRRAAGIALAIAAKQQLTHKPSLVLALPRGGVPVAFEVAQRLQAPLDVMLVRKIGMPGHKEYAIGAIASGGISVREPQALQLGLVDEETFSALVAHEQPVLEDRERMFRRGLPALDLREQSVLLVDDGLATGSTMRAAILATRRGGAARICVAVPIAAREARESIRDITDQFVALIIPEDFYAVGQGYIDFRQVSDDEVIALLQQSRALKRPMGTWH
jgi:putative phosphoribosyl transferase